MGTRSILTAASFILALAISAVVARADGPATQPANADLPDLRGQPAGTPTDPFYQAVLQVWGGGNVRGAERMLVQLVAEHPEDIRLLFFQAICRRVRSGSPGGHTELQGVIDLAVDSLEGKCAAQILKFDQASDQSTPLAELQRLQAANPQDPLILLAVGNLNYEVRNYQDSLACSEKLAQIVQPGPGQLHHLWANSLDMLNRFEEALVHRRIALQLEEGGWSHGALALTLTQLGRFDEANAEYAKAVQIYPIAMHWRNWGWSLYRERKFEESAQKYQKVTELEPEDAYAWSNWGNCLRVLGQTELALSKYEKARELNPSAKFAYGNTIDMLRSLGRDAEADKIREQWKAAGNTDPLD